MQSVDYLSNKSFLATLKEFSKSKDFIKSVFFRGHLFSYIGYFVFMHGITSGYLGNIGVLYTTKSEDEKLKVDQNQEKKAG